MKTKTFKNLKSYKKLLQLKEKEVGIRNSIRDLKQYLKEKKAEISKLSDELSNSYKSDKFSFDDSKAIQKKISDAEKELEQKSKELPEIEKDLPAVIEEVKGAEEVFIKEAIPVIDDKIEQLTNQSQELQKTNDLLNQLRVEANAVKRNPKIERSESPSSSFLKEPLLRNQPGITTNAIDRLTEIAEYQKEQWKQFTSKV